MKLVFVEQHYKWIVGALLGSVFVMAVFSSMGDSATNDEVAHIPAGYSYLVARDFRLNQEHPPLIKDLAAFPLLFLNLQFPFYHQGWTEYAFGQWVLGEEFLYNSGNNPDQILFWARLPMILVFLALGLFLFYWAKRLVGLWPAFLVLVLYLFSPTFLAHGRLVTTDVGATFGFAASIFFFLRFLEKPSWKNALFAGMALGVALLTKFSTVLLLPFLVFLAVAYIFLYYDKNTLFLYAKRGLGVLLMAGVLVGVVYQFHIAQYPFEKAADDTKAVLSDALQLPKEEVAFSLPEHPVLRPYGHYALGFLRTTRRVGNITPEFFLGNLESSGWWYYFPVLYMVKVPLAFHILTILALAAAFFAAAKKNTDLSFAGIKKWTQKHFQIFAIASFVALYAALTVVISINIGVRHLLPIFPFLYLLVALGIKKWIQQEKHKTRQKGKIGIVLVLLVWYVFSSTSAFPDFLSYYNEVVGGSANGYRVALSSNYDWGQDVKRLAEWVEQNNIQTIYVDLFGKGNPEIYYMKEKAVQWKESWEWLEVSTDPEALQKEYNKNTFPKGNYFAVSLNLVFGGGWDGEKIVPHYDWLQDYTPVARAGRSIFIYYIDK